MDKKKFQNIDYFFWILFIIHSNPGGVLQALGLVGSEGGGSVSLRDLIFFILLGLFIFVRLNEKIDNILYKKTMNYLIVFGLYYFIVFGYFTPIFKLTDGYSFFTVLKKSRTTIYSFLAFLMSYHFYIRSNILFFRGLILSSIIILILFIATIITGTEILPIERMTRGFVKTERIFLLSYGYMPLLIPIGAIVIVFIKDNFKWKKLTLFAFALMFLSWLLSITRRHIIGTVAILFLAIMLFNYFQHKSIISLKKFASVFMYAIVLGFIISLSFPKYLDAGKSAVDEVVMVFSAGETSTGSKDTRLGMGKDFMKNLIINSPFFGTGFDNRWRTKEGDELGYEAADYPLIGAIAMTGIFGILLFLPIYILLVKSLIFDIKYLRKNKVNYHSFEFFSLIIFILYFIYDLIQYMNWFLPVSLSGRPGWYIYLAMYFASRQLFYSSQPHKIRYA